MFRLDLFRIRMFTFGNLSGFLSSLARGGLNFILVIWLQGIWLPLLGIGHSGLALFRKEFPLRVKNAISLMPMRTARGTRIVRRRIVLVLLVFAVPWAAFRTADWLQQGMLGMGAVFMAAHDGAWLTLALVKPAAMAAAFIGTVLLISIAVAGRVAMNRQHLLPRLFVPGLRVTLISLVALICLHTALIMATLWSAQSALFELASPLFIAFFGVTGLTSALSMSRAALCALHPPRSHVRWLPLQPEDHPELWRFVSAIAATVGTSPPDTIVAGLPPIFFVTESDLQCPEGRVSGRTLYLSISACRILTKNELGAIIAHELAHFRGEDTALNLRFGPVYRGAESSLVALRAHIGSWLEVAVLPAFYLLSFFLESFARAESNASRCRETACDRVSALAVGAENIGSALVKCTAFTDLWHEVRQEMQAGLALHRPLPNAALHYAQTVSESSPRFCLRTLDQQADPHPYDDHPPLSARLAALGITLAEVEPAVREVRPPDSALWLFSAPERLETALTDLENQHLTVQAPISPHFAAPERGITAGDRYPNISRVNR